MDHSVEEKKDRRGAKRSFRL